MLNKDMMELGKKPSAIRELFEYGKRRAAVIGKDNVFDFSIGNPSVPAPQCVNDELIDLLKNGDPLVLHGYTSAAGDLNVRETIAEHINKTHGTCVAAGHIYMTCGAAASLTISIKALCEEGDEFIAISPFFPEYRVFVANAGAKLVVVESEKQNFQPDLNMLEKSIGMHTKAVIINSPNNPSGVVYSEDTIKKIADILTKKSKEYGRPIFIIADEPYRELVYGAKVPYVMNYYRNTLVCYSYSKSLSLPGERIGYIAVCPDAENEGDLYAAICGAGRSLGFVCAPSLFQQLVARCVDKTADIEIYRKNRDMLCEALTKYGYRCIKPDGAFYLFIEALEPDSIAFCEKAKQFELLLVPADSFGCKGFVRISYCVRPEQIQKALPAFEALAKSYGK